MYSSCMGSTQSRKGKCLNLGPSVRRSREVSKKSIDLKDFQVLDIRRCFLPLFFEYLVRGETRGRKASGINSDLDPNIFSIEKSSLHHDFYHTPHNTRQCPTTSKNGPREDAPAIGNPQSLCTQKEEVDRNLEKPPMGILHVPSLAPQNRPHPPGKRCPRRERPGGTGITFQSCAGQMAGPKFVRRLFEVCAEGGCAL